MLGTSGAGVGSWGCDVEEQLLVRLPLRCYAFRRALQSNRRRSQIRLLASLPTSLQQRPHGATRHTLHGIRYVCICVYAYVAYNKRSATMEHKERQPMVHTCTAAKGYRDLQQCRPPAKHCFISEMRKHDIKSSYGNCFAPVTSRTQPQNLRFPPPTLSPRCSSWCSPQSRGWRGP